MLDKALYDNDYARDLIVSQKTVVNIEKLKGKSIFITGACGLIGSALVEFLLSLNNTRSFGIIIYVGARNQDKYNIRFGRLSNRCDLHYREYDATLPIDEGIHYDYIIHAASKANPRAYVDSPVETMLSNFNGVHYALEYAKRDSQTKVLYISSSEVYGKKDNSSSYKEDDYDFVDILNPRACYPSSKRAAETLCVSYIQEYGVSAVIVRPGHVYGPTASKTDTRASSQFPQDVAMGHNIIMKSVGTQIRSYCYVVDCVAAILTVLISGKSGNAYNISNVNSVCTIRDMAQAFADAGNKEIVFERASDKERAGYNLMDNSSLDAKKLEALGWTALFDMKIGAEHTLTSLEDMMPILV